MRINNHHFDVEIFDEWLYDVSSTDNIRKYSKKYLLGEDSINTPHFDIVVKNANGFENLALSQETR